MIFIFTETTRFMRKLVSILSLGLLIACSTTEQPVDTIDQVDKQFGNGKPEIVTQYVKEDDKLIPYSRIQYHPNGEIMLTGKLDKNGERHGVWKSFYPSGQPWSEGGFDHGLDHGKRTTWFENGQKRYEGQFTKGKKTGNWKFWDENGKIDQEENY